MLKPHETLGVSAHAARKETKSGHRMETLSSDPQNLTNGSPESGRRYERQNKSEQAYSCRVSLSSLRSGSTPIRIRLTSEGGQRNHPLQIVLISCIFVTAAIIAVQLWLNFEKNAHPRPPLYDAKSTKGTIADIAEIALPSTVMIKVEDHQGEERTGSGFFINNKGDILTNYHVVGKASKIVIITNNNDEYSARIRGYNQPQDIALLSSNTPDSESIPLKISGIIPKAGTEVLSVGAPGGLHQTLSSGIVSAVRSSDNVTYIQITAPISPGSSGGPVINMNGDVIGVSTMSYKTGQNLNFAVSSIHLVTFIPYAEELPPVHTKAAAPSMPHTPYSTQEKVVLLPNSIGFLGIPWGSSLQKAQRVIPDLKQRKTGGIYMTRHPYLPFGKNIDVLLYLGFNENQFDSVLLIIDYKHTDKIKSILSSAFEQTPTFRLSSRDSDVFSKDTFIWEQEGLYALMGYTKDKRSAFVHFLNADRIDEEVPDTEGVAAVTPPMKGEVTANILNCRTYPNVSASVDFKLEQGDEVTITHERGEEEEGRLWYYILCPQGEGWVNGNYIYLYDYEP